MTHGEQARAAYLRDCLVRIHLHSSLYNQCKVLEEIATAARREAFEEVIKAGEREAYKLAPRHSGSEQLAVRMILEAQRGYIIQQTLGAHE